MRGPYRPPPKKNPVNQYRGAVARAQGKRFESYIDASLKYYQQQGLAIVEKTPEPMRPTKDLGNGKFIAFPAELAPYRVPIGRAGILLILD